MFYKNDTIAAIATPLGKGSVAIIRVSGNQAIEIASKIFKGKKNLKEASGNSLYYGKIIDPENQREVDQVLVSVFKNPHSFTGEDLVEINSHGGMIFPNKILNLLIKNNCRLAEKGEFSKRAFLNGKIDLTQAEAINDMIQISTYAGSELALSNLNQKLSRELNEIKENLMYVLGLIQVKIDNPEEEIDAFSNKELKRIENSMQKINQLIKEGERGRKIAAGFRVVLTGRTNAGKSSVLNRLAGEEKAIVSHLHGTTRDVIEVELNLKGYPVILIDTAGIRDEIENEIEGYGIIKAREEIKKADLVLYVIDYMIDMTKDDKNMILNIPAEKLLIGYNKIDSVEGGAKKIKTQGSSVVYFSTKTGEGIENLISKISEKLQLTNIEDSHFYVNQRQNEILFRFEVNLSKVLSMINEKESEELIAFELTQAMEILGELLGFSLQEDLLDTIFCNFCLGK